MSLDKNSVECLIGEKPVTKKAAPKKATPKKAVATKKVATRKSNLSRDWVLSWNK
ncbi:hypothetical protein Droror1_Dr00000160, partial [Drosera rotundifolia]